MSEELICYSADKGIAVITLTDPPANTYSYDMMRQLDAAILEARMDSAVHVIVLTGAGEKFFCAGADIGMLNDVTANLARLIGASKSIEPMVSGRTFGVAEWS